MSKGALMSGIEKPPRGRRLCPRRRAVDRAGSDFLSKNRLQHVAPEIAGAAEELFLAFCEANSRLPFLFNERNETHEVRDLKEPVSPRPHVLREFPVVAVARRHGFVDEVRYDGLAAIVIRFALLLIMSDKRHDVKPRVGTGKWKVAGFVHEYAQSRVVGHGCKARAAGCPPLKAKNFLRVSVTPAFRPSSVRIVPNSAACRKEGARVPATGGTPVVPVVGT